MTIRLAELRFALTRPFPEQVAFFRGKLGNLVPTATWRDMQRSAHDTGFMVAGAGKADLLADLAAAVDAAHTQGESLDAFRARFGEIVQRHGWQGWTGSETAAGRAWRTRIIYTTNLSTSYAAGRLSQLKHFPLWVYRHGASREPRPQHLDWNGLVLPSEHPFWRTHYPPSAWNCSCYVIGAHDMDAAVRRGGTAGYTEPPEGWDVRDARGRLPGVDEGWDYAPGASVADHIAETAAAKTIAWPYELAKAFMQAIPAALREALAIAQRSQPQTGVALRRYAERALGQRNGASIDAGPMPPYQTLGLLTTAEAARIAELTGVEAVGRELYDWTVDRYAPRHIHAEHGDEAVEAPRGQRAIRADDYTRLPTVILSPDRMWLDEGMLMVEKTIAEERFVAAFAVLSKRRMVLLKSMRIYRRVPRAQRP